MPEFIIRWSPYGPSGRIEAPSQDQATQWVVYQLTQLGLETEITEHADYAGQAVVLRSPVKRYGDRGSVLVCVYPLGGRSWYDAAREHNEKMKAADAQEI